MRYACTPLQKGSMIGFCCFFITLPVEATPGSHQLHGWLRYQAWDQAACSPPCTLQITASFIAK